METSTVNRGARTVFLLALAAVTFYFCYLIAQPFLSPIFAAIVIAIAFYPLHGLIRRHIPRRSLAATLTTVLVLLLVTVPPVVLGIAVSGELSDMYQSLSRKSAAVGGVNPYLMHLLEEVLSRLGKYVDLSQLDLRAALLRWLEQASRSLLAIGGTVVSNIFAFAFNLVIVFFTLFFLFREGGMIRNRVAALLPLSTREVAKLFGSIHDTVIANLYGGLAVGLTQGSLTGIAFWVLGVPSPILWALVTVLASLVPMIGSALVWGPASIFLLATGHWGKALILLGWGAAVVAQVDALVRPYVVSERAKAHTLLVFFALLGGMKAFGFMGLFIGPIVLSIAMALLDMLREMNAAAPASPPAIEPTPRLERTSS